MGLMPTEQFLRTAARIALQDARELISSEANWVQGIRHTRDGRMCALGALDEATLAVGGKALAVEFLAAQISDAEIDPKKYFDRHNPSCLDSEFPQLRIANYNNTHYHHEVIAKFDAAIDALA